LSNSVKTKKYEQEKKHKNEKKLHYLGRKWYGNVKEAKKIRSYVKYETSSAAKRKATWSQKLDFYLQILAKWSLEIQVASVSLLQTIEFYTKPRQINRILSEERRKFEWKRRKFRLG